jgi:hypothetical protein
MTKLTIALTELVEKGADEGRVGQTFRGGLVTERAC